MIFVIYLASGNSKRFLNKNKLLIDFRGKPLFRHGLDTLYRVTQKREDCEIVVVSRYDEILQYANHKGFRAVYSQDSVKGLSYSIIDGLTSIGTITDEDFIVFMVADQPFLRAETIKGLFSNVTPDIEVMSLSYEDRLGNPKIFSGKLVSELRKLVGDVGGKQILHNHQVTRFLVASSLELLDIDREDYLNHITNIFITGSRKIGKTTLIRTVMTKLGMPYNGYLTVPDEVYSEGSTYVMIDMKTGDKMPISKYEQGMFRPIESTFEAFGVQCIQTSLQSEEPYAIFDEVGRFERQCNGFLEALTCALDSSKLIVAVLKKEEIAHIKEYKKRKDCVVLDLDGMSMEEAEEQLVVLLEKLG